jgi:hypothetical protein
MNYLLASLLMILSIALTPFSLNAAENGALKTMIWERYFGQDNYSHLSKAIALSAKDKNLYITGQAALPHKTKKQNSGLFAWGINKPGELATNILLPESYPEIGKMIDISAISSSNSNIIAAVVTNEDGKSFLVNIDKAGKIAVVKKLESEVEISKIIPNQDGSYLHIGRESLKELVIKTDASGKELWRKVFDRGRDDMIVDGISIDSGGFLLIENSGKVLQFFMGESDLFVAIYDSKGERVNERYLPGRYGSIARGKDGNYVIVYDKSASAEQDIWVQAYDKNLNPLWNQKITTIKFGLERFKIVSLANGNYVVAGSVNGKPWVSYLDSTGAKKWDYLSKEKEFGVGIDLVADGNDCYLVSSIITLNAEKAMINKVKVIKFQPQ